VKLPCHVMHAGTLGIQTQTDRHGAGPGSLAVCCVMVGLPNWVVRVPGRQFASKRASPFFLDTGGGG